MVFPQDAVLPQGSLVLVTGATGYVASRIVDELLAHGYRVRGTVRDPSSEKASWMPEFFEKRYDKGKLELVPVKDLGEKGCLDDAVKGCDGVVHAASNLSFGPDPNIVIGEAVAFTENALEAAAKEPSVKRFVFTSSSSAAQQWTWNKPYDLTADCWDEKSVKEAWAPPPYLPERGLYVYNASKVSAEKAVWKFMKERDPHFVANTVLLDYVCGLPVSVEKQGYPTSISMLKLLWENTDGWQLLYAQHMIDTRDSALLHVAGLASPDLKDERIFGYAHNKTWTDWIQRLKRIYPDHKFPDPPPNEGVDMANIVGQKKAEDSLRWLGEKGWRPMEESMREVCDTLA